MVTNTLGQQAVPAYVEASRPKAPVPFDGGNWGEVWDRERLKDLSVPKLGPSDWRPIPHDQFVGMAENALESAGFRISDSLNYVGLSRESAKKRVPDLPKYGRFLTMFGITHKDILPDVAGISWEMALVQSCDMSIALGGLFGKRVHVCSNGMFNADYSFRRKHTKGVDPSNMGEFTPVDDLLKNMIANVQQCAEIEVTRMAKYKETECTQDDARFLIIEAVKNGVIAKAHVLDVLEHFNNPEHVEFKEDNVWSLENAFTSFGRGRSLFDQGQKMSNLTKIIDQRFYSEEAEDKSTQLATTF
mgnify:FL=1